MKISKISIHNGLFLGIILVTFTLALSYANPTLFLRSKTFLLSMPFILILIKAATEFRKKNQGIATFKELFYVCFFCSIIAIFICSSFEYLLFNFINTDLILLEKDLSLEALEISKQVFSEDYIEKHKSIIETTEMHSLGQTAGYIFTRIVLTGALFSIFVALLFKRKETNITNKT